MTVNGIKINFITNYGMTKPYIVYRIVDGENYFYGGYLTYETATAIATKIGGEVVYNPEGKREG